LGGGRKGQNHVGTDREKPGIHKRKKGVVLKP